MRKSTIFFLTGIFVLLLSAFAMHKFYVAIYQINYSTEKKQLQITTRIFTDDLNAALLKKYKVKTNLGETSETAEDAELLKKYLNQNFSIKVNGQPRPMFFHSKEIENNVLICYFSIKDVTKVKSLYIQNAVLTEVFDDQQNIIQANFAGKKQSLLLSGEQKSGTLNFD